MNIYRKLSVVIIASFFPIFTPIIAHSLPFLRESTDEYLVSLKFPELPEETAADNTVGAGKRDSCGGDIPLTAIAPKNNVITTLSKNPSLYWFIPETNAAQAEFILVDSEGNDVYVKEIKSVTKSGLVKLTIPKSIKLQSDTSYEWKFLLTCTVEKNNLVLGINSVGGQIQLLQLTNEQQEKLDEISDCSKSTTQLLEKASLYAEYRLWQETLETLQELRQLEPDLGMTEWSELLNSVGIETQEIVRASFIGEL